jgi:hypothetical protein
MAECWPEASTLSYMRDTLLLLLLTLAYIATHGLFRALILFTYSFKYLLTFQILKGAVGVDMTELWRKTIFNPCY